MFEGTGLGLSLVRGLVGLHGGSLTLESVLEEGTRVTVRLPLDCRGKALSEAAPAPMETLSRLKPAHLFRARRLVLNCAERNKREKACLRFLPVRATISILSAPAPNPARKGRESLAAHVMRRLFSRPARTIAGATLAAVLTGIVVNALVLQKGRRPPSPIAAARPAAAPAPVAATPAPPPATQGASVVAQSPPALAEPPARPIDLGATVDSIPVPPTRGGDPIRDLLRGDAGKDAAHLTIAAQNALIKLGFAIKADGVAGASTVQAIQQFERAHGMPQSGEITPRLVKQLAAAANSAAR